MLCIPFCHFRYPVFPEDEVSSAVGPPEPEVSTGFSLKVWTNVRTNSAFQPPEEYLLKEKAEHTEGSNARERVSCEFKEATAVDVTSEKLVSFDRDPRTKLDPGTIPSLKLSRYV